MIGDRLNGEGVLQVYATVTGPATAREFLHRARGPGKATAHHGNTEDTEAARKAGLEQDSFDAVWEKRNIEVHQQASGYALKTQVGHKLSRMNRQEPFNRLDLDNQRVFNQEVNNITLLDPNSLVLNR